MKKIFLLFVISGFIASCSSTSKEENTIKLDSFKDKISYALGADMGGNFANFPEEIFSLLNPEEIANGFHEILIVENPNTKDCLDVLRDAITHNGVDSTQHSMAEVSYCYGALFGESLRKSLSSKNGMGEVDFDMIKIGFLSSLYDTDTLIAIDERQRMIIDFNNDLNKQESEIFITKMKDKFPNNIEQEGYILIENQKGNGEILEVTNEFNIAFTFTNSIGDTLYSSYIKGFSEEENAQTMNADILPEAWKKATSKMEVGGEYTIYANYDLAYGEDGLLSPNSNYIIQPFAAITIHSKVFSQGERYSIIKNRGKQIIEEAKKEPNTYVDKSGYVLTTIEKGTGELVPEGGDVQAHYVLTVSNGQEVDNSYRGAASGHAQIPTFSLNQVVKGWQYAIPKMRIGGKYKLVLPYDLGYGETGNQRIEPYETLIFEIEIVNAGKAGTLTGNASPQQLSEEQLRALQEQMRQAQ